MKRVRRVLPEREHWSRVHRPDPGEVFGRKQRVAALVLVDIVSRHLEVGPFRRIEVTEHHRGVHRCHGQVFIAGHEVLVQAAVDPVSLEVSFAVRRPGDNERVQRREDLAADIAWDSRADVVHGVPTVG